MTASSQHVPHAFTAAQREFEDWRATRTSIRKRIPEPLWSLAMDLAIEHGTYRTAKALRLNSDTLKKRLEAVGTRPKALTKPKPAGIDSANFLALDASTVTAAAVAGVEGTIEFESPNGARVRIQWRNGDTPAAAVALCQALLGIAK